MGQINLKTLQQRIAYKDANFYVTKHNTYSKITTEMLIQYASENSGIPEAQMSAAFHALKKEVRHYILNGHSLELMDLGTLYLSVAAKAVVDEEDAGAKAVKRVSIKFRQSKKLRTLVISNVQLVSELTKKQDDDSDGEGGGNTSTNGGNSGNGTNTGGNSGSGSNTGGSTGGNTGGNGGSDNGGGENTDPEG